MGEFAKRAAPVLGWEDRLKNQQERLGKFIPSSQEEATAKAVKNIEQNKALIYSLGYELRKRQREAEGVQELLPRPDETLGVPGREVVISLPRADTPPALEETTARVRKLRKRAQEEVTVALRASKPDEDYSPEQLRKGMEVEKEHTDNPTAKKIISKNHLDEFGNYYTGLKNMEKKLEEKKAGIVSMFTSPIGETLEDLKLRTLQKLDRQRTSLMRTTSDPSTLPWYYSGMVSQAPKTFMSGYSDAEKAADKLRLEAVTKKMEEAQADFEKALSDEYRQSRGGIKTASCGEFIDGLARVHVKAAEGELNQALGVYLALASLLGQAAHSSAYDWVAKRDPARQKLDAFREAIKQRMRTQIAPVQVETPTPEVPGPELK